MFVPAVTPRPDCEQLSFRLTKAETKGFVFVFLLASLFWKEAIASLHLLNSPIRYKAAATHEGWVSVTVCFVVSVVSSPEKNFAAAAEQTWTSAFNKETDQRAVCVTLTVKWCLHAPSLCGVSPYVLVRVQLREAVLPL